MTTGARRCDGHWNGDGDRVTVRRLLVWWSGIGVMAGGLLVIAGALLPWLTLYAGLRRYAGMAGLYGRLVLTGGALAVAAGAWMQRARSRWMRWSSALLGAALTLFIVWLT